MRDRALILGGFAVVVAAGAGTVAGAERTTPLQAGAYEVRTSGELGGGPTWIVEEVCDDRRVAAEPAPDGVAERPSILVVRPLGESEARLPYSKGRKFGKSKSYGAAGSVSHADSATTSTPSTMRFITEA